MTGPQRATSLRTIFSGSCGVPPTGAKPSSCRRFAPSSEASHSLRLRLTAETTLPGIFAGPKIPIQLEARIESETLVEELVRCLRPGIS